MKMLMIVCPESNVEEIRNLISQFDIHAYSELHDVTGEGEKGKKLGTRVWPGKSVIVFMVLPEDKKEEMLAAVRECRRNLMPEEGLHAFVLPVEEAF
jgi:nitrogen regulatory protein PII